MDEFVLIGVAQKLILPPGSLITGLILGGIVAAAGLRKIGLAIAVLAAVEISVLSLPPVSHPLMKILEDRASAAATQASPCCYDAIVVLGGTVMPGMPPLQPDPHLNEGAERVWKAARLYHRGVAPTIIVSGGPYNRTSRPEAEAMRQFLLDLGVPSAAIVMEEKARNTAENIRDVRAIVGDRRVALVTSAYHMPRALRLAAELNLNVAAFPTDFRTLPRPRTPWESNGVPSLDSLEVATTALRELLALAFDRRTMGASPAR